MEFIARYVHGSEDSTDLDVYYVVDALPSVAEMKAFCSNNEENRNLIVIEGGVITQCYKGIPDESNNGLLATYGLHSQTDLLLIDREVERDVGLKLLRVLRCVLSHFSRSPLRHTLKQAIRSTNLDVKQQALKQLIDEYFVKGQLFETKEVSFADLFKILAFQVAQIEGLYEGVAVYTKADAARFMPVLRPYLYRESVTLQLLGEVLSNFADSLSRRVTDLGNGTWVISGVRYDVKSETKL